MFGMPNDSGAATAAAVTAAAEDITVINVLSS